jgi:hypothetical protein
MEAPENAIIEKETPDFSDAEIFTEIWTSPRLVFRYLHQYRYDKFLHILLILAGILKAFDRAATKGTGDVFSLTSVILLCVFVGGAFGWISYYIYTALISLTGKWLGGKGNTNSLLRVMAHAMIPYVAGGLFLIPQMAIFGIAMFQSDVDLTEGGMIEVVIFYLSVVIKLVCSGWTVVILCIGVSEIQKMPVGKAVLNILLPAILIFLPLAAIAFILGNFLS